MTQQPDTGDTSHLERGTFEVVRDRLLAQSAALHGRAEALNRRRIEIFGGMEMAVLGTERIRTDNNCVPRDIVGVGDLLLFGYNVFIGLRKEISVSDTFSLHRFLQTDNGFEFPRLAPGDDGDFLDDPAFVRDFRELFQYYKGATLAQLRRVEAKLLAVFRTGESLTDVKVFRWEVGADGSVRYIDNRGERDAVNPPQHDFEWAHTTRDDHVLGDHPHVSILDEVFVETVGGDLTIKIENNTADGLGIYREPVAEPDQSLDDASISYAKVGSLILLRVLPYREDSARYLVFNTRTRSVRRIDAIGLACVQLPEDHGIIFPGGYYLRGGETKSFDQSVGGMQFSRMIRSPNGEDVLYVFHRRSDGARMLLPYNLIRKEVVNPLSCHGYSLFEDGRMVIFSATSAEATRVHPMQVWKTPFAGLAYESPRSSTGSYLEKVGNADLVRGISDALGICRMIENQDPRREIYEDLIAACTRMADTYYWLGHEETGLLGTIREIQATGEQIIDEFEKVESLRAHAASSVREAATALDETVRRARPEAWGSIEDYVATLGELRAKRGHLISLRELRYSDRERLDQLEHRAVEAFDEISRHTLEFLMREESLAPYSRRAAEIEDGLAVIGKVAEADAALGRVEEIVASLNILVDILDSIRIDDATVRIELLDRISSIMGGLNRLRAVATGRRRELLAKEGAAEFGVQLNLLEQNVTNALGRATSPESCDAELSRLLLLLENLETRFGEFDEFLERLGTKRDEILEAFSARRQSLVDAQQRRADQLMTAAGRILEGVVRRAETYGDADGLNAFFASDPMVEKLRDTSRRLRDLGDVVRADEIDGKLKAARGDAARSLRDRADIFEEGANVIRLGDHRFSVNTRKLDMTMLPRDGRMDLHLTGTSFFQPLVDPELDSARDLWSDTRVSESADVYRGEYLATAILDAAERGLDGMTLERLTVAALTHDDLLSLVRDVAVVRYDEGYERGVHDEDTARILAALLAMLQSGGLLRYPPCQRAAAALFWWSLADRERKASWERQAHSLARIRRSYGRPPDMDLLRRELDAAIAHWIDESGIELSAEHSRGAGAYLLEEIGADSRRFVQSGDAAHLLDAFLSSLRSAAADVAFRDDLRALDGSPSRKFSVARAWLRSFAEESTDARVLTARPAIDEAAAVLVAPDLGWERSSAAVETTVTGLVGTHPRIKNGTLHVRLDELLSRLERFRTVRVPAFRRFQKTRHEILEAQRRALRLSELEPRVMSAFVRNRLINDVYLPLVGANLAKQMGTVGEGKRTDLMGLLLLVSPPGYGKTTLMEYFANRLGLVFVKINGPALGNGVTSLDPSDAPNATARQEIVKLNLALEMGNNVMLYVDDIQHTNPEFLQKFISLCDAQRKIEGVWNGEPRTYDLRGRRFCVCMAGNPYTESGEKFQIPDMLANRADVYNLGEVLAGKDDLFELSYIENALTSNPVTAPLLARDPDDVYLLVRMAKGEAVQADQLKHDYSATEIAELMSVMKKLVAVQRLLSRVNRQYIRSAAQENAYRTEPPFRLQGSYRNMNKLAERIVPAMNDDELERLIDDHYLGEAQTLTTGAEENLLKLAEIRGRMTEEQRERWDAICREFTRRVRVGAEEDPASRLTAELSIVSDRLGEIGKTILDVARTGRAAPAAAPPAESDFSPLLATMNETMQSIAETQSQLAALAAAGDRRDEAEIARLATRESFLIGSTLVPLVRFMAHRFKGYRGVKDPDVKNLIARLEHVDGFDALIRALEGINDSMLAALTDET
jgi:hypothetical protein